MTARLETKELTDAYRIQGETLNAKKLEGFWSLFGLSAKATPDVTRRAILLANLRNRLYHHWPVFRDVRDYPTDVFAALEDAQIAPVNTTWPPSAVTRSAANIAKLPELLGRKADGA